MKFTRYRVYVYMRVLVFATVPLALYYTDMPLYSTFRLIEGAIRHVFVLTICNSTN